MAGIRTIFFDLDGTLTDSAEGIINCAEYALRKMNGPEIPRTDLAGYIGGSLRGMFATLLATDDQPRIEEAVAAYRERYGTIGLFENHLYPGVPEMLEALKSAGCTLYIATSKATFYAEKILNYFAIDGYFSAIHGSGMDGSMGDKSDLLAHIALAEVVNLSGALMVGDREYDIVAAKRNAMRSAGVLYGYGSRLELLNAGADFLCRTPGEVAQLVDREFMRRLSVRVS